MAQTPYNPFKEIFDEDRTDLELILRSRQGDRRALESLILRHQSWIYNIAIRMVYDPLSAEDITQEVLIKIITKLSSFDPSKSAFRTWVYRIVVNHVINAKQSKREAVMEEAMKGEAFEEFITRVPDRSRSHQPGDDRYQAEIKMACVQCVLLCLNRRERMVFILGAIFGVTDSVGSELCGITKVNFRKILSRTRGKLFDYFNLNCSLLNKENPCRCVDLVKPMLKNGVVVPADLLVLRESHGSVRDIISNSLETIEESYEEFLSLFRDQPFLKSPDMIQWLRELMEREDVKSILRIGAGQKRLKKSGPYG